MILPKLQDLKIKGKRVLLRLDLDVPVEVAEINGEKEIKVKDNSRIKAGIPTIKYLLENGADQIIILGHMGRPQEDEKKISTWCLLPEFVDLLGETVSFWPEAINEGSVNAYPEEDGRVHILENLRFNPGEEANDPEFTKKLANLGDVYVNDAFAVCHREAASIVGLPQEFKFRPEDDQPLVGKFKGEQVIAAGLNLEQEIKTLNGLFENSVHPTVFVLGGGKLDKVLFVDKLLNLADEILVGGVLPQKVQSYCRDDAKMCVSAAHLMADGRDITPDSARNFAEIIKSAKTIIWNGPVGDVDSDYWDGTKIVAEAIAKSSAYKVAGGGDTIGVINKLGISDSFNYISTGGGAFLEFLAYGDLPGLCALRE